MQECSGNSVKDNSYVRHEQLADALGERRYASGYRLVRFVPCTLHDGRTAWLIATANAGFRGIEGYFEATETGERFHASLGEVAAWVLPDRPVRRHT